jgi:hypothetical protein
LIFKAVGYTEWGARIWRISHFMPTENCHIRAHHSV